MWREEGSWSRSSLQRLNRFNLRHDDHDGGGDLDGDDLDDDGDQVVGRLEGDDGGQDDGDQVVGRLEGEGGALATRAGGGPGTNGVRSVTSFLSLCSPPPKS